MRGLLLIFIFSSFYCFGQKQLGVNFKRVEAEVVPIPSNKEINVQATYSFDLTSKTDSIFLDAQNMTFFHVALDKKEIPYSNNKKRLIFKAPNKLGKHTLFLRYNARPKQALYFIEQDSLSYLDCVGCDKFRHQVWTQGQGKYTSHWLPSIDDMNDKIEFDFTFIADEGYQVIANGRLKETCTKDSLTDWKFDMQNPMSSYLAAFAIGNYDYKHIKSKSGVSIELYYEPQDSSRFEPTYRHSKEIFDFLEEEIGVPYPWQNYKQVPVRDFLYAGMENTSCTLFSNQYMIDSTAFVDKNYVNVNAHELAHQWFGNLVTEESGDHHWLHEGFATYYAYLAERQLFGDTHFYWKLYNTAKTLNTVSEMGDGEALMNPKASSLTFYEKGAWALVMLNQIVGEKAYKKGIQNYLKRYAYKNVTIDDFLLEIEKVSGQNLKLFKLKWLESEVFPWKEVKNYLQEREPSIKYLFSIERELELESISKNELWDRVWKPTFPSEYKNEIVIRYHKQIPTHKLEEILKTESLKVKQAVAKSIPNVPINLKSSMETLLLDNSYVTQEISLLKLWKTFTEDRKKYLAVLDGVEGLPNKNIRLLWLALALITPEFKDEQKKDFYQELNQYTNPKYSFETRQLAFQYLYQINALSTVALKSLILACNHHVWQFKKSSRNLIREIHSSFEGKQQIKNLRLSLTEEENQLLDVILNP